MLASGVDLRAAFGALLSLTHPESETAEDRSQGHVTRDHSASCPLLNSPLTHSRCRGVIDTEASESAAVLLLWTMNRGREDNRERERERTQMKSELFTPSSVAEIAAIRFSKCLYWVFNFISKSVLF